MIRSRDVAHSRNEQGNSVLRPATLHVLGGRPDLGFPLTTVVDVSVAIFRDVIPLTHVVEERIETPRILDVI